MTDSYRDNYIQSLRNELLGMVKDSLSPVAVQYGYSEVPLETNIKWRPQVLVLGNYSSGKSTLINEFLGADIQKTGQAPTDDSFTIITYDNSVSDEAYIRVTDERDGRFLLNDPEYPFESLKKHGQRFASHFRLKKVNSPFLRNLAIIDTPGMLDSITERDRGYNYQEVIGDLAQIVDLVLVLFDPHKAGTVREAYRSLRDTLPSRTFEDRVLFVLNRIDECSSLIDLIRVYGTLCWNLSQMTGRKDIPAIRLTYSPVAAKRNSAGSGNDAGYLSYLENQRDNLKEDILEAPRHRLDHLATFVETHSERLAHFLESLVTYKRRRIHFHVKFMVKGLLISLAGGGIALVALIAANLLPAAEINLLAISAGSAAALLFTLWMTVFRRMATGRFHRNAIRDIDTLTPIDTQTRRDSWQHIKPLVLKYLKTARVRYSLRHVKREYSDVLKVYKKGSREIREALNELSTLWHDDSGKNRLDTIIKRTKLVDQEPEDPAPILSINTRNKL